MAPSKSAIISPIAMISSIERAIAKGLLIDPSNLFPEYTLMKQQLKIEQPILISKAVLKRYVELDECLWHWYKESNTKRLGEILSSLYCCLRKVPANEKTITFQISAVVEENAEDPDNDKVIEPALEDSPNLGYKICSLKAVIDLAEDKPIIIMLPGEN